MIPAEYEYLRKILKDRSGLVLSVDRKCLFDGRLIPLARKAAITGTGERAQTMKADTGPMTSGVADTMTINEILVFGMGGGRKNSVTGMGA